VYVLYAVRCMPIEIDSDNVRFLLTPLQLLNSFLLLKSSLIGGQEREKEGRSNKVNVSEDRE